MPSTNYVKLAVQHVVDQKDEFFHGSNFKIIPFDRPKLTKEKIFEVFSYKTNIGCFNITNKKAVISGGKWSATTTRHIKTIIQELKTRGFSVVTSD